VEGSQMGEIHLSENIYFNLPKNQNLLDFPFFSLLLAFFTCFFGNSLENFYISLPLLNSSRF